jgi:tripartite-type tricarboxylate transporter receptor subunit TctC
MFPDTPTMEQAGIQGFDAGSSYGFLAPAGTPPEVVARLNTEINKILAQKSVRDRLMAIGAEPSPMSAAEFRTVLADDSRRFGAIIRERKITIE